jgi:Fe-S-cluster-containing dehydrogenase component/DMSO reductase anchor subunit
VGQELTQKQGAIVGETRFDLIDRLIAEQQYLSAVERFAQKHEQARLPLQAKYYRDLIPLTKPSKGQQYSFEVDLDRCTGCKACVSACHSLNGLEENETWRDVGLIVGELEGRAYQQTVTTACHHCLDPGCLEGCPVMAYQKEAETGIVRHLDDQCIGCQYCTMKCPYDVPKYSKRLGIVRKCDMCHDRLAAGEAPACVQACPHEAIRIRIVDQEEISRQATASGRMLPGAYDSSYTKPATRYVSKKTIPPEAEAANAHALALQPAHVPLLVMLVLTQAAVGIFTTLTGLKLLSFEQVSRITLPLALFGFGLLSLGLSASLLHLGRPLGAWRFFLGLKTSWMSREILAFGVCTSLSFLAVGAYWFAPASPSGPPLIVAASLSGLVAIFTSAMIYVDTRRLFWNPQLVFGKFYGTMLSLGTAGTAAFGAWLGANSLVRTMGLAALVIQTVFFFWEMSGSCRDIRNRKRRNYQSAVTIARLLPWFAPVRTGLFLLTVALLVATWFDYLGQSAAWCSVAFLALLASQFIERFVFFTAVIPLRMPGGI